MGWLTTSKDAPTLRAKVAQGRVERHVKRDGAMCSVCRNPIKGAKKSEANVHPKCAKKAPYLTKPEVEEDEETRTAKVAAARAAARAAAAQVNRRVNSIDERAKRLNL